jgi:3-dehydroquinate synthetase
MYDKKRVNQKNPLILIKKIGESFINKNITDEEIIDFFDKESIQ